MAKDCGTKGVSSFKTVSSGGIVHVYNYTSVFTSFLLTLWTSLKGPNQKIFSIVERRNNVGFVPSVPVWYSQLRAKL